MAGPALRDLDPALAADLVACRLRIGYPVAPASTTRAYASLPIASAPRSSSVERRGSWSVTASPSVVEVDGRLVEAGSVIVAAGPWTPEVVTAIGATRRGRRSADLGRRRPASRSSAPRHVLEEIDIDIEPDDGDDGSARATVGVSTSASSRPPERARSARRSCRSPEPSSVVDRSPNPRCSLRAGDCVDPVVRTRTCARPLSPTVDRSSARSRASNGVRRRGPRAVGDLDRSGYGANGRRPRAWRPAAIPMGSTRRASAAPARESDQRQLCGSKTKNVICDQRSRNASQAELETAQLRRRRVDCASHRPW